MRPFRFGYQLTTTDPVQLRTEAVAAEEAGFDVLCSFDHLGQSFDALSPLAFVAAWTQSIRVCPLVINNDFHHPALLAQELATLDLLSGGRLEVGIGAGHSFTEYAAAGIAFEPPDRRKARLAESVEVLRNLLDGEAVTHDGEHYHLKELTTLHPAQAHVPLLVGVNGRAALGHAARHADIIGLTMFGRTMPDGQYHEVRWEPARLDATIGWIRQAAGPRFSALELNALVQAVVITNERTEAAENLVGDVPGLNRIDALTTPFLAIGTYDEIAEHFLACRQRWGISYYVVRDIEAFTPVIDRLRRADN
jgi:probable F420-dependent oxidoreductase